MVMAVDLDPFDDLRQNHFLFFDARIVKHFRPVADEIYVINVGGYIGSSTRSEIEYAKANEKGIRYLEV